jgi:hypothetical protein
MGSNPIIGILENVILRGKIDQDRNKLNCAGSRTKKHENAIYLPSIRQLLNDKNGLQIKTPVSSVFFYPGSWRF